MVTVVAGCSHLSVVALVELRWERHARVLMVLHHLLLVLLVFARQLLEVRVQVVAVLSQIHLFGKVRRIVVRVIAIDFHVLTFFRFLMSADVKARWRRNRKVRENVAEWMTRRSLSMT